SATARGRWRGVVGVGCDPAARLGAGVAGQAGLTPARWAGLVLLCLLGLVGAGGQAAAAEADGRAGVSAAPTVRAVPAGQQADNVAVVTIHGDITAATARSVKRRIETARKAGADALVFWINTNGGEGVAMLEITRAIKSSPIPNTVAWVHDDAYSAGAIIALACKQIVVSDAATMGDAAVISLLDTKLGATERAKLQAPGLADVVDSARVNGYDELLVQGFVSLGVELWMLQSVNPGSAEAGLPEVVFVNEAEYRAIFGAEPPRQTARQRGTVSPPAEAGAASVPAQGPGAGGAGSGLIPGGKLSDLAVREASLSLTRVSERPVFDSRHAAVYQLVEYATDGRGLLTLKPVDMWRYQLATPSGVTPSGGVNTEADLKAFMGAKHLARLDQAPSEAVVGLLVNPVVRVVLLVLFLSGLIIEMLHPGVGLAGLVAGLALLGLVSPALIIGLYGWWGPVGIVLGVVLFAMEIFVTPGFGVLGLVGGVCLMGGLLASLSVTFESNLFPEQGGGTGSVLRSLAMLALGGVTSVGVAYWVLRNIGSVPVLGKLVLSAEGGSGEGMASGGMLSAMGSSTPGGAAVAVGSVGRVMTPLRPSGRVLIDDAIVDVVSDGEMVPVGATVRVREVTPFRVSVAWVREEGAV
ncbi:MAG: hypothetical protein C0468_06295, partial [Planctomyces sp.]|nr:hypothetical protein [Planctomyces sp.]